MHAALFSELQPPLCPASAPTRLPEGSVETSDRLQGPQERYRGQQEVCEVEAVDRVVRRGLLVEVTSGCDLEEVPGELAVQRSGKERLGRGNSKHRLEQRERRRGCAEACRAQMRLG